MCWCRLGEVTIGDVVGLRDGAEGMVGIGEVVLFLKWTGSGMEGYAIMSMLEFAPATIPHTWRMHATCCGMSLRDTSAIEATLMYSRGSPSSDAAIAIVPPKWRAGGATVLPAVSAPLGTQGCSLFRLLGARKAASALERCTTIAACGAQGCFGLTLRTFDWQGSCLLQSRFGLGKKDRHRGQRQSNHLTCPQGNNDNKDYDCA